MLGFYVRQSAVNYYLGVKYMTQFAHTQAEYDAWGHYIEHSDQWLYVDQCNLDDVSLVARLIYAEDRQSSEGQASVAQELHNRMRCWKFLGGDGINVIRDNPAYKYTWKGVIYGENAYGPMANIDMEILSPTTTSDTWKSACDFAYTIVESTIYSAKIVKEAVITTQLFHTGYSGRETEMEQVLESYANNVDDEGRHYWNTDSGRRYDVVRAGDSLFYNDVVTVGNKLYQVGLIPATGVGGENNTGIATQTASDFIDFLKSRVGCGYVLGTYGQICTQQLLEDRAVADPENGSSYYLGDCARWMGKLVTDCSGLIEWFLLKRGVSNCDSYSGGMYKQWCSERSTNISIMPRIPGIAVFKRNDKGVYHVGIYVGKDRVIEAKGAMYGVVVSQFSADDEWNAWGYLDWLNYDLQDSDVTQLPIVADALTYGPLPWYPDIRTSAAEEVEHSGSYASPVYRKGDSGTKVEMIRRRFWAEDSSFVVNDFFDDVLENKVKAFQEDNDLTVDGLVGSGTWRALFPVLEKKLGTQPGAYAMQALLNYQNYPVGTPDGLFGTGTETVLKAYQEARQLDPDGICGEKTWQSLTLEEPFEEEVLIDQNGDYTTICEMGDTGNTVKQLQQRLATVYYLNVTGTYDAATDACVRAYQQANGITANGNVGPITWNRLFPILKLGRGSKDEVRALQMLLCNQKHRVLIDGIFGTGTQAAVKAYQTLRNLTSDGIVGENTWESLCLATPPEGAGQYYGTGGSGASSSGSTIYRQGDTGAAIHQIKRRMAVEDLFTGTVNSTFDAVLTYDVKSYQASEGLRVDGLVGPATWSMLFPIVEKQVGQQEGAWAVQALLNLNGYNVGTPDGLFGTGSETKLKQFQAAKGLTVDGICGANTWAKLCEV